MCQEFRPFSEYGKHHTESVQVYTQNTERGYKSFAIKAPASLVIFSALGSTSVLDVLAEWKGLFTLVMVPTYLLLCDRFTHI